MFDDVYDLYRFIILDKFEMNKANANTGAAFFNLPDIFAAVVTREDFREINAVNDRGSTAFREVGTISKFTD